MIPPDTQIMKFLGWFFILLSLPLGVFTFSRSADKIVSPSWPFTYGEVLSSDMYQRTGRSTDWCVRLRYQYTVDQNTFSTNRLSTSLIGNAGCDRDQEVIAARLRSMRPGDRIKVRYNSRNPEKGIIYSDGLDVLDYFLPGLVLLLLVGGLWQVRHAEAALNISRSVRSATGDSRP